VDGESGRETLTSTSLDSARVVAAHQAALHALLDLAEHPTAIHATCISEPASWTCSMRPSARSPVPALTDLAPYYFDWLAHPTYDAYWREIAPRECYERITAPALNIGGWYDLFLGGTLTNYRGMRERGGSSAARRGQPRVPRSRAPVAPGAAHHRSPVR
jgi:predicted acyl esterase